LYLWIIYLCICCIIKCFNYEPSMHVLVLTARDLNCRSNVFPSFWTTERSSGINDVNSNTGLFEMIVGIFTIATSFSRYNPTWLLSMGLRQGSDLCSSSSRKYQGTERTNQNRYWNHHRWHATNSLERTRLSCWCL